jgi:hypothetical protein
MKKLIIILLFWVGSLYGQKLPVTGLCLADVLAVTGGRCIADAFTFANPAYFDPDFAVAGGNWLDDFRNYGPPDVTLPSVSTTSMTEIYRYNAVGGGNVTDDGGATVTARGVCWNTSTNPTTSNSHTSNGTGTGSFSSNLLSLSANTLYYVRAYATNSEGTSYGSQISFTTSCRPLPSINNYYYIVNGTTINSGNVCNTYASPTSGSYLVGDGLTIGQPVYAGTGSDCTKLADGYYLVWYDAGGGHFWIGLQVSGGILYDACNVLPQ